MAGRHIFSTNKREFVYSKFNSCCAYCGCKLKYCDMAIDHFVSLNMGGGNEDTNLFPSCSSCNSRKSDLSLEEFRQEIINLPYENYPRLKLLGKYYDITPKNKDFYFYFETFNKEKTNG